MPQVMRSSFSGRHHLQVSTTVPSTLLLHLDLINEMFLGQPPSMDQRRRTSENGMNTATSLGVCVVDKPCTQLCCRPCTQLCCRFLTQRKRSSTASISPWEGQHSICGGVSHLVKELEQPGLGWCEGSGARKGVPDWQRSAHQLVATCRRDRTRGEGVCHWVMCKRVSLGDVQALLGCGGETVGLECLESTYMASSLRRVIFLLSI